MWSLLREAERKWKGHIKGARKGMERTLKEHGEEMARNELLEEEGRGNGQTSKRREAQRSKKDMEKTSKGNPAMLTSSREKLQN